MRLTVTNWLGNLGIDKASLCRAHGHCIEQKRSALRDIKATAARPEGRHGAFEIPELICGTMIHDPAL